MNAVVQGHERVISLAEAIREGIEESFKKDESTFLFAQGVSDPSSMWGTLKGIGNKFTENRVIEMPIAEMAQSASRLEQQLPVSVRSSAFIVWSSRCLHSSRS